MLFSSLTDCELVKCGQMIHVVYGFLETRVSQLTPLYPRVEKRGSSGLWSQCSSLTLVSLLCQEGFFDLQEALQSIHMRREALREQLATAKSKGEETMGRCIQVTTLPLTD